MHVLCSDGLVHQIVNDTSHHPATVIHHAPRARHSAPRAPKGL